MRENTYSILQSDDEEEETEDEEEDDEGKINNFIIFLDRSVFVIEGIQGYGHARIKKELLGLVLRNSLIRQI